MFLQFCSSLSNIITLYLNTILHVIPPDLLNIILIVHFQPIARTLSIAIVSGVCLSTTLYPIVSHSHLIIYYIIINSEIPQFAVGLSFNFPRFLQLFILLYYTALHALMLLSALLDFSFQLLIVRNQHT